MAVAELEVTETLVRKERSLLEESWIRLRRNKVSIVSMIFIGVLVLAAIFANFIAPFDYATQDLLKNNAVPSWMLFILPEGAEGYATITSKFPLGADYLGRDLLSRTLFGARVSLSFAFVASGVSLIIGTIYGMISGYVGGRLDDIMMRIVDFLYAFPFLVVVILLQTYFKAIEREVAGDSFLISTTQWEACFSCLSPLVSSTGSAWPVLRVAPCCSTNAWNLSRRPMP